MAEPGKEIIQRPFQKTEIRWLKSAGLSGYDTAEVSIALPAGFDPDKSYPVLVTCVTGDRYISNTDEMDKYWPIATELGWVTITGWASPRPRLDKLLFRRAVTVAAVRTLRELYPGSIDWPVAVAGFSGGSKNAALMAGYLQREDVDVIGIFMGGCNEDYASYAARKISPDGDTYRKVPIFLSAGLEDTISTPEAVRSVEASLMKYGFENVRLATYPKHHVLHTEHVRMSLEWFMEISRTRPTQAASP